MKRLVLLLVWMTARAVLGQMVSSVEERVGFPQGMDEDEKRAVIARVSRMLAPFTVYGAVLDQHQQPVDGATVTLRWEEPNYVAHKPRAVEREVYTDGNGQFKVEVKTASRFFVEQIRKPGFEFREDYSPFYGLSDDNAKIAFLQSTSSTSPMILTLRKKGETAILVVRRRKTIVRDDETNIVRIVFADDRPVSTTPSDSAQGRDLSVDLCVKAAFSPEASTWVVAFRSPDDDSGVLEDNEILYEAPEGGYRHESTIAVGLGRADYRKHVYLYVKSRKPPLYSRVDVELVPHREILYVNFDISTNPYGDRVLEDETDLPWDVRERLEAEATAALAAGRLPEKPELERIKADTRHSQRAPGIVPVK